MGVSVNSPPCVEKSAQCSPDLTNHAAAAAAHISSQCLERLWKSALPVLPLYPGQISSTLSTKALTLMTPVAPALPASVKITQGAALLCAAWCYEITLALFVSKYLRRDAF